MGGRVVEGTGLENRQTRKRLEGSNPSPSTSLTVPFDAISSAPAYFKGGSGSGATIAA
jgi:hypothetical protein